MTKEEPVAYFNPQEGGFYWAKPTTVTAPITVDVEPLPLYTTPQTKGCDECGVGGGYALYCLVCVEKFFGKGKEWVGLTDDDLENIKLLTFEKEINSDGEEQEAVDLDHLMRATEQLCKEKNT